MPGRSDLALLLCAIAGGISAAIIIAQASRKRKSKKRKSWMRNWRHARYIRGYGSLIRDLRTEDPESYINFLRMSPQCFEELLDMIKPTITKRDSVMRMAIPANIRLAVTLRFLATGKSPIRNNCTFWVSPTVNSGRKQIICKCTRYPRWILQLLQ